MARLMTDPAVKNAARVGATFCLDPVALLGDPDPLHRAIRVAAHNIAVGDANQKG